MAQGRTISAVADSLSRSECWPSRPNPDLIVGDCFSGSESSGRIGSPLVASRSLGRLLGLESLHFKVESGQPTGSWLDRGAGVLVAMAAGEGVTGLGVIGIDACTLPLAVQCVRAGLRLVILEPAVSDGAATVPSLYDAASPSDRGWLTALGARVIAVEADLRSVQDAAPSVTSQAGLRLVAPSEPLLGAGLREVVREIDAAGHGRDLLVVSALTGQEPRWLVGVTEHRSGAVPLDGFAPPDCSRPVAIVGVLGSPSMLTSDARGGDAVDRQEGTIHSVGVTTRETEAAQRLLAGEEGLLVSHRGGAGFAALARALREDRARRPRERRLRGVSTAVVVVTGEPLRAGVSPPVASDAVLSRPVSLAALSTDLSRLLVKPPGR
jgi:cysteine synthase